MAEGGTPAPELCRLEYWNPEKGEWEIGHHGVSLLYPHRYPERLKANGKVGRVHILDADMNVVETIQLEEPDENTPLHCRWCTKTHPVPHDGSCLL